MTDPIATHPTGSAASRTPRTDAAVATVTVPFEREEKILVTEAVPADFARTLELEAADLRSCIKDLRERLAKAEAALTAQQEPVAEPAGDTGNQEADKIINRLMSDDPDFDDCIEAAAFIRKLVVDHRGPDGFATWKDAAIAARIKRTAPPSGVQPTDGRASMQAELGAALGSALSHYKSGDMQACAASLVRIVDLFRDTPQPAATWDAHGNSGMRHPEESDVSGGATDCARQPADGVVVPREQLEYIANNLPDDYPASAIIARVRDLLAAAKEPRK